MRRVLLVVLLVLSATHSPSAAMAAPNQSGSIAPVNDGVLRVSQLGACRGTADDSQELQRALDTGLDLDFEKASCLVSSPLRVTRSGQRLYGRGATITTSGPSITAISVGARPDGSFIKTDRVSIEGLTFVGQADGIQGPPTAAAVVVHGPPAVDERSGKSDDLHTAPFIEGAGCSGVVISNIEERGFVFGVAATGADRLTIRDSVFGGNYYFAGVGAGGYGVLLQSCFKIKILNSTFTATPSDRHAIYVSADPSREKSNENTCKQVVVQGNTINWTGVIQGTQCRVAAGTWCPVADRPTYFEVAVVVRAADDLVFSGNIVQGGYGGIVYEALNGSGSRVAITGNTFSGQAVGERGEPSTIGFLDAAPENSNVTSQVSIVGNALGPFLGGVGRSHGITLSHVHGAVIEGNTIVTNGISALKFDTDNARIVIGGNLIEGRNSSGYQFSGERNESFILNRNSEAVAPGRLYRFDTVPTSLTHGVEPQAPGH